MKRITKDTLFGDALDIPGARTILQAAIPGVVSSPMMAQLRGNTLAIVTQQDTTLRLNPDRLEKLWDDLGGIEDTTVERVIEPPIRPDPTYETGDVPRASARASWPPQALTFERFEVELIGPDHGNPFVDVDLSSTFTNGESTVHVGGFYDGNGRYVVRFLPLATGTWSFATTSTARSLDGISGTVEVTDGSGHGPVRVVDTFHFAHADGTRFIPVGTTLYAWTHQESELEAQTLASLRESPFNKVRMCVFPKAYLYNDNEPSTFVFPRQDDGTWDTTRFEPAYFAHLERRLDDLAALGIEADLILFHPYDRWGFSDLGATADDRYLRYLVRRLASFPNIWWSLANEYDLVPTKTVEDWERIAAVVVDEDPVGHLLSIHNCVTFYDYSRPWITHSSVQRIDAYRTSESVTEWREQWGKPVVVDEVVYEGDIDQGWGNITAEELTRRFWEGTVRGGYLTHGETYLTDDDVLWWSKGGVLHGESPARIAFLREVIDASPSGIMDPLPSDWDNPRGGHADDYVVLYFGFNRPRFRMLNIPEGNPVRIDIIDTWNMTIEELPGEHEGSVRVELPGRQYMAIRTRCS